MKIEQTLQTRLEVAFAPLKKIGASKAFPPPASLSSALEAVMPAKSSAPISVGPDIASLFGTAAVNVWLRSVHSFLISASLTEASPIWASTVGYYSSHYAVRALAHLLGYFQLYRKKRIVRLDFHAGKYICTFDPKQGGDREHRLYWRVVKRNIHFAPDPLFTENEAESDASDVGHRDRANYADHLSMYPNFRVVDDVALRARVQFISQIEFTTPPIPRRSKFPDVEAVQLIAYHRIVRFRQFLDEVLGGSNRFWTFHRNPSWTVGVINFQLTEQGGLKALQN